ncbi:MAG: ion transporter [Chloroflexi bacterium]|nr:ion transporter [Chloroflexota bacterium]
MFHAIDLSLLAIFTAEYFLNLWVAPDRRKYALSLWGIVDLLAILPAYIELTLGGVASLVFLRQLRILRVMRMLKLLKLAAEQAALLASFSVRSILSTRNIRRTLNSRPPVSESGTPRYPRT